MWREGGKDKGDEGGTSDTGEIVGWNGPAHIWKKWMPPLVLTKCTN